MDMLRFHKFTIGWNWIADYGSSDNPEEFKALYAYSPLHNLRKVAYPPTMVTTADHDDRVVPAHSFKYAATLQERQQGNAPVLIRIETKSGHGASNTAKQIEGTRDVYAFLFQHLGVLRRLPLLVPRAEPSFAQSAGFAACALLTRAQVCREQRRLAGQVRAASVCLGCERHLRRNQRCRRGRRRGGPERGGGGHGLCLIEFGMPIANPRVCLGLL
jgi:hypothetical protein